MDVGDSNTSLLDESTTWAAFGRQHLDRRVTKALTASMGLQRPTLVQSRGIPVALEGKDLLCRARTGSGKTLCYAVPLVQRLLVEHETRGSSPPLAGLVLVPTKELIIQVQTVLAALLAFCHELLNVESVVSGQKYMKAELPTILVTTPSSLMTLVQQKQGIMLPMSETLKVLVVDEADLMFSFGYEEDMRALCAMLPSTYQAMLFSATLSDEVEQLKGLMLHKPVTLKLEEPRVTGKLSQFYLVCRKGDKFLILYTLLKLQLIQGKCLVFVNSIEAAYKVKIFLERFSINAAVLNSELPHASRQNIIQAFNQNLVELLIATDEGVGVDEPAGDGEPRKRQAIVAEAPEGEAEAKAKGGKARKKARKAAESREVLEAKDLDGGSADEEGVAIVMDAGERERPRFGRQRRPEADNQYSLTRGVDLPGVSTVINADVPSSVRDYVHRVGRCARGGASGTALTLCAEEEEVVLERIIRAQASSGGVGALKPLPMQIADAERFRYRVEDMTKSLTKRAVAQYRARELQMEALHSEKLKSYFEEHPEDKQALQRAQRALKESKSIRQNLRHVPSYLVPEHFAASTPVQQAVREASASGASAGASAALAKRRSLFASQQDPLQGFLPGVNKKSTTQTLREKMEAIDRRIDPATANLEDLPPLSGGKLWKIRHGKRIRRDVDQLGERRRLSKWQLKRKKKFDF